MLLDTQPVFSVTLIAVESRNLVMRGNNDAPRSRVAREHLAAAIIGFDRRLEVDCLNIQNLAGRCHASYIIIADTGVTFNLVDNRRKRCKPPCKKWSFWVGNCQHNALTSPSTLYPSEMKVQF
jgi:hypothetical protein